MQPSLAKVFPELEAISPACIFATSSCFREGNKLKPRPIEKALGEFGRPMLKTERGILVLENVTQSKGLGQPMVRRNKTEIMTLEEVKTVLEALACFHGTMWSYYHNKGLPEDFKTCNKDDTRVEIPRQDVLAYLIRPQNSVTLFIVQKELVKAAKLIIPLVRNQLPQPDASAMVEKIEK